MVSVTEGDDKPRKYPQMLRAATVVLLNKVDLLPYVPFDSRSFLRARSSTQFQRARVHAVGAHRAGDGGVVRLGAVAIRSLPPPNETPCSLSQPELERHGGSKATTSLQELAAARSIA